VTLGPLAPRNLDIADRWLSDSCLQAALETPPRTRAIPVLRNEVIDRWFARAHPAVPALVFAPAVLGTLHCAFTMGLGPTTAVSTFAAGLTGFTLFEYLLHRFIFHRHFGTERAGRITAFLTHGYHHSYPNDSGRLVLPPMLSLPVAALIAAVYVLCLPRALAAAAFAGTATGYVAYDSMHWWLHHGRARTRVGRFLKRYHALHHGDHRGGRFGVSTPLWDVLLGTYSVARSSTLTRADTEVR
jgi:sterol desaturase/sphingolipid hydroxylase (fatty acid hydroxylase superfamily)